ncbi:dof zinc finger protein dof1.5 [Phtheirospermum japonicum]|uniref:Dof zinc finger protein dof1.5 n=1 Tax=Phtheirospermum japonicum TaxID=374723 RepID=A0A830C0H6_9LAMI|nr:dof zinc finger protein dof1.5 [Phtheirospermum japonicum]
MMKKRARIQRWIRSQTRSSHAQGAKAWRPSFVTSTTTTLISPGTFARPARGTGPPAGPSAMCPSALAAGKPSRRSGAYRRMAACLTHPPWVSKGWRSGERRSTAVLGISFRRRG